MSQAEIPAKIGARALRFGGLKFVGVVHLPARKPPSKVPAVLFLHGFPGSEQNVDIQRALQARGVASFSFRSRGSWGSEGTYRFSKLVPDARAALRFLRSRTEIDAGQVGVFGFSMGGWTALNLAAQDTGLKAVCAVSPAGGPETLDILGSRFLTDHSAVLRVGSIARLRSDCVRAFRRWNPHDAVSQLGAPLLLIHGDADETIPLKISEALASESTGPIRFEKAAGAGHDFLDRRAWLSRTVAEWLTKRLKG